MHSLLQLSVRSGPRNVLKVSCKRKSRSALLNQFFHSVRRLRDVHDSGRDGTDTPITGEKKPGFKESEYGKEVAKRPTRENAAPLGGRSKKAAGGPEAPSQDPDNPHNLTYYGSALRRRQRNRNVDEPYTTRSAPEWFVNHNIQLRENVPEPPLRALTRDSKKGYVLEENEMQGSERSHNLADQYFTKNDENNGFHIVGSKETMQWIRGDPTRKEKGPGGWISAGESEGNFNEFKGSFLDLITHIKTRIEDGSKSFVASSTPDDSVTGKIEPGKGPDIAANKNEASHGQDKSNDSQQHQLPQYFINAMQDLEIRKTARGLMRLPLDKSASVSELAAQKSHLLLYYPAPGGDYLLNNIVSRIAIDLECDLISIDAHDISELIALEGLDHDLSSDGRLLSYDVYCKEPEIPEPQPTFPEPFDQEEADQPDDTDISPPHMQPFGAPVIIGKPITIHLKDIIKPRSSERHGHSSSLLPQMLNRFFDPSHREEKPQRKSSSHIFTPVIESIISAAQHKRNSDHESHEPGKSSEAALANGVLIHVRDLKAIQETSIGHQFLSELYEQVQQRRASGESMIIVGTDCAQEWSPYSKERIQDIEKDEADTISRTIVVTPVLPHHAAKRTILQDKHRRTITINMRHLWSMMRLKDANVFASLEHGFWNRDFLKDLHQHDQTRLSYHLWSFSHVHRLSTILTATSEPMSLQDKYPVIDYAYQLLAASDNAKYEWAEEHSFRPSKQIHIPPQPSQRPENPKLANIRQSATRYEKRLMNGIVEPEKINTTFNDIHIPMETIDALQTLTTLSLVRPDAFSYGVLASDKIPGLLLYGPPGTGKTLAAKAVAKESGATMLEVSAADINNMYVGEGEKNVQALFSLAKKLSPCVVFLDEADAMFSARATSGKRVSHRELLNQFLKEWDGMSNDSRGAFIMVATNRPMDLDDAVLRRLPRRVLVDLPAESDRLEILKIHLRNEQLAADINLANLASRTPFYSGSDLKNLCVAAALNCVREENELAKEHNGEDEYKHPERRTLTAAHFEKALEEITASISEDMSSLREIKKFDEQYGDRRGKKRKGPMFGFKDSAEADRVLDTVKVRN